ncbi:MAG TPA: heavy metal-binding domain-containing protein, partial [Verrucomicrobiae bacterium]
IMKSKIVMTMVLAVILGAGAVWFAAPQRLNAAETNSVKILRYTCPMHPSVKTDKPGDCPICGMHLVYEPSTNATPVIVTNKPVAMMPGCCSRSGGCR